MNKFCLLLILSLIAGCAHTQPSDYCLTALHPIIPFAGEKTSKRIEDWLFVYEQKYYDAECYASTKG